MLNMPFEAARTRSQIQPKDLVVTLPVGTRMAKGAATLSALLAHASATQVVAFPLAVDGTAEALPSLGSLAELNFIAPKRRPCLLVGSARYGRHVTSVRAGQDACRPQHTPSVMLTSLTPRSLTHKLSSTATFSALEHGTEASGALKLASSTPKGGNAWAHHATPSLSSYMARRLAFTRRASLNYTGACVDAPPTTRSLPACLRLMARHYTNGAQPIPNKQTGVQKVGEATRLLLEAFFHLGFVLSFILIVGTPVSMCVRSCVPLEISHRVGGAHPLTIFFFLCFSVHPKHSYYTPGNYCNFYWSNQCTNGQNMGTSLPRFIATCIAACYTGTCGLHILDRTSTHSPSHPPFLALLYLHSSTNPSTPKKSPPSFLT